MIHHYCGQLTRVLVLLTLWLTVAVKCNTPQKLYSFDDVSKALYNGAPVRIQVNNVTACNHTSGFISKHSIAKDVDVAMVTDVQDQSAVLTWNKIIIDGAIFNTTGPATLLTEIAVFANGTMTVEAKGWGLKNANVVFSGKLSCHWMISEKPSSEAVVYQQDKLAAVSNDFAALDKALHAGFSMSCHIDLNKMEPPGQGHLIGRMERVTIDETQFEFHQVWFHDTQRTDTRVQITPDAVVVTQLSRHVMDDLVIMPPIIRKGTLGPNGCIRFLALPYDS